jgi:alpha-glucoside transport system permease protein
MVPAVGVALTSVRPAHLTESSGWWTIVQDPALTLDNLRTVLDTGMWSGLMVSSGLALTVAVVAVVVAWLAAPAPPRPLAWAWVLLAAVPASVLLLPAHDVLDLVGLEGNVGGAWLVQLLLAVPVAVLVVAAGTRQAGHGSAAPALSSAGIIVFLLVWADLLVSTTFLAGSGSAPATVRLAELVGQRGEEQHLVAAAAVATMVVPVVVLLSARRLLLGCLVGDPVGRSAPDRSTGVGIEEVQPIGVHGQGGVLSEADAGVGVELGDAHGGAGLTDLIEGVGVTGDRGGRVDGEVDEHLGPE